MTDPGRRLVVGVGNPWRRDDGVGHAVLDALAAGAVALDGVELLWLDGEPTRLLDAWQGAALAVVVDAVRGAGAAGALHCREIRVDPPSEGPDRPVHGPVERAVSGHTGGLPAALRLGSALGRLPGRLVVVGVEADDLGPGEGLSAPVAAAVPRAVAAVQELVRCDLVPCPGGAGPARISERRHRSGEGDAMRLIDAHSGMEVIDRDECLRLLAMHMYGVGRLALVEGLHPVIVPVNYAMDEDRVVFRTAPGTKLDAATRGAPVCFEIDELDPDHHMGWSVVVKGHADIVTSPRDLLRLGAHPLRVWAEGERVNWVAIRPDVVTGRRINGLSAVY